MNTTIKNKDELEQEEQGIPGPNGGRYVTDAPGLPEGLTLYKANEGSGGANNSGSKGGSSYSYAQSAPSYISQHQNTIDRMWNGILNREAFTYDPNTDPMYQQYADSYTRQGKQAMEDTLAQVSARTGGLASSYAGTAAQQTYNGYMSALADKVPELRQLAYQMYMDEGDTMRQNLNMLQGLEQSDYNKYLDVLGQWNADRNFNYGVERDRINDQQWQQKFDYEKGQDDKKWKWDEDGRTHDWNRESTQDAQKQVQEHIAAGGKVEDLPQELITASGYSPAQLAAWEKTYAESKEPKVTGGGKPVASLWGGFKESPVSDVIMDKIETITNQDDLTMYLGSLAESGIITEAQMMALFNVYKPEAISPSITEEWAVVDNGGLNWGWGVDNNAKVRDRNGITYTLKELVDKLVDDGMTEAEAEDYVKQLQKELGI